MFKRQWSLWLLFGAALTSQIGCAPLAAGVVGAAVGHEVAEERAEDERERDR
jgi:hypothetical protein